MAATVTEAKNVVRLRLTQIDGALPNLALMKLAHWHRSRGDEVHFTRSVQRRAGVPPTHLRVYMLIGYDPSETWQRIFYRFERMTAMGIQPFVMVKDRSRLDLRAFQRWANLGLYRIVPWSEYRPHREGVVGADIESASRRATAEACQ